MTKLTVSKFAHYAHISPMSVHYHIRNKHLNGEKDEHSGWYLLDMDAKAEKCLRSIWKTKGLPEKEFPKQLFTK